MSELPREKQNEYVTSAPLPDPRGGSTRRAVSQPSDSNAYNFVADKVGFVPNVRKSDNALQAKVFAAVWLACVLIGLVWGKLDGALMGALLGLVVALIVSGGVLTVVGLKRKS